MANLRFPEPLDATFAPWILFASKRPTFNRRANDIKESATGESVGLYFPTGVSVSDELNYDTESLGALTGTAVNAMEGNKSGAAGVTKDNVLGLAESTLKRIGAGAVGAGAALSRGRQKVTNPQEFMLFNSPGMRSFSFSFSFLPQSQKEADTIPLIIKFFRRAAYPVELNTLEYEFPDTFAISYSQSSDDIIRMPEVACTSVGVTYNPNSMSFFNRAGQPVGDFAGTRSNQPVETTLELSFTELRPISRSLVEEGF